MTVEEAKKNQPYSNLTIIAHDRPTGNPKNNEVDSFTVEFNPNSFIINNKIEYAQPKAQGGDGGDPTFKRIPAIEFSIEFTIDGTGVGAQNFPEAQKNKYNSEKAQYVKNRIKALRSVTGCEINGDIHRPNYLSVLWGTICIQCVLNSLNITYNLFAPDGSTLRAKVNCGFTERINAGQSGRQSQLESPDLTKYKAVIDGDILPLIIKDNYDDAAYYIQVAKANKLKNFRRLVPGTTLILPPLKDNDE